MYRSPWLCFCIFFKSTSAQKWSFRKQIWNQQKSFANRSIRRQERGDDHLKIIQQGRNQPIIQLKERFSQITNPDTIKTDFPGRSLGTSTNPGDYRFLEKSIQGNNMVLSGTQISLNDRQNLWKSSAKMNLNSPRTTKTFLRARTTLGPEDKYEYPFVSSFNYGWRLNDHIKEYKVNIKQTIKLYIKRI